MLLSVTLAVTSTGTMTSTGTVTVPVKLTVAPMLVPMLVTTVVPEAMVKVPVAMVKVPVPVAMVKVPVAMVVLVLVLVKVTGMDTIESEMVKVSSKRTVTLPGEEMTVSPNLTGKVPVRGTVKVVGTGTVTVSEAKVKVKVPVRGTVKVMGTGTVTVFFSILGAIIRLFLSVPAKTFIGRLAKGCAAKAKARAIDTSFLLTLNLLRIVVTSLK